MENELSFRLVLLLLFTAFIVHRGYYTRRASHLNKSTIQEREETWMTKFANLIAPFAFIGTIVYLINPEWMSWAALLLPLWLRWSGLFIAPIGFVLLQWAHHSLGTNWSDTPRLMVDQTLTTEGPYRWIRHPIYTAFLLIMSAVLLLSANWFIGSLWIGMTLLEITSRVKFEEAIMLERFGDQYRVYMKATGKLLPRIIY